MIRRFVLWPLRAAGFVMELLFVWYFVCVQINAIGYLVGKRSAVISGMTPPARIDSLAAAVCDIVAGLVFEAVAALISGIAIAFALTSLRDARRVAVLRPRKASRVD
jgi:hypothetical protein